MLEGRTRGKEGSGKDEVEDTFVSFDLRSSASLFFGEPFFPLSVFVVFLAFFHLLRLLFFTLYLCYS